MGIKRRVVFLPSRRQPVGKQQYEVSDFQWQSVAEYYRHIEVQAGLIEFSLSAVYSFHIVPGIGIRSLVSQKVMLVENLKENLKRIREWVKANDEHLDNRELVLVRSLWRTTRALSVIVEGHIIRAEDLAEWNQLTFVSLAAGGGEEDELPF